VAKFNEELPYDLLKQFEDLEENTPTMMGEMCKAGARVVYGKVCSGIARVFKRPNTLLKGLKITKVYKTPSDDGINVHIGFYGYDEASKSDKYPKGKPIPLIALAREYGTSSGEKKRPFFRKAFSKKEIESAMLKVQESYIGGNNE